MEPTTVEFIKVSDILAFTLYEDENGSIWVGSRDKGCLQICRKDKRFSILHLGYPNNENSASNNRLLSFAEINRNEMLLAAENRLLLYDRKLREYHELTFESRQMEHSLSLCFCKHSSGQIFIGSSFGVLSYDPLNKKVKQFYTFPFKRIATEGSMYTIFWKKIQMNCGWGLIMDCFV